MVAATARQPATDHELVLAAGEGPLESERPEPGNQIPALRWQDIPRCALEALAAEGYRAGALSENQIRRLLGYESRFDVHALLKEHRVPLRYSEADVQHD